MEEEGKEPCIVYRCRGSIVSEDLVESGSALLVERFLQLGGVDQLEGGLVLLVVIGVGLTSQSIHIPILIYRVFRDSGDVTDLDV